MKDAIQAKKVAVWSWRCKYTKTSHGENVPNTIVTEFRKQIGLHLLVSKQNILADSMAVVLKLFLIAYHLCVPYCHHVPPYSRKSQCAKYQSIKSLENQN